MLFTFILEFDGVNSVSQFSASDVDAAFHKWVQGLGEPYKYALAEDQAKKVAKALAGRRQLHRAVNASLAIYDDELNPVSGMKNVWCIMSPTGKAPRKWVLLNIVATISQTRVASKDQRVLWPGKTK